MHRLAVAALLVSLPLCAPNAQAQAPVVALSAPSSLCEQDVGVRVTLPAPAPAGGTTVQLASTFPATVPVPPSLVVPAGATSASVSTRCAPTTQPLAVTISASAGGSTGTAVLNVLAPVLQSLAVKPNEERLPTGEIVFTSLVGSASLAGPAPAGGVIVTLSATPDLATVPTTLAIPAGASRASYTVTALRPVSQPTTVTLTATGLGSTRTTTFNLAPPTPVSIQTSGFASGVPAAVNNITTVGGFRFTARVTLSAAAAVGGQPVTLTSTNPAVVHVPPTVTVHAGALFADVEINTIPTSVTSAVTVTASTGSGKTTFAVTVTAVALDRVVTANSIVGGMTMQASVHSTAPAAASGLAVQLSSSNAKLTVPSTVTIPAGARFVTFPVISGDVDANTTVTITALTGGVSKTHAVTVIAEGISDFAISAQSVQGGSTVSGRLVAPTGHNGFTVSLVADSASAVSVPATVTFGPNETIKTFQMLAKPVSRYTPVVLTATVVASQTLTSSMLAARVVDLTARSFTATSGTPTVLRRDTVVVTAPKIASATFSSQEFVGGTSATLTGTIRLSGPAPANFNVTVTPDGLNNPLGVATAPSFVAGASVATFVVRAVAVPAARVATVKVRTPDGTGADASVQVIPK